MRYTLYTKKRFPIEFEGREMPSYSLLDINWTRLRKLSQNKKHKLDKGDIENLNKVSVKHYGSYDFTDIILLLNHVSDPFSLKVGDILMIPPKRDLMIEIGYLRRRN